MKTPSSIMGLVKNREVTRMNKEANKDLKTLFFAGMVGLFLVIGIAGKATGVPVTTIYEFVQDESTVVVGSPWGPPEFFSINGQFDLTVDFDVGIASFDDVDATLSGNVWYWETYGQPLPSRTNNLDVLFKLTELESVYVSDTQIDFYFDRNLPMFPDSNIRLSITFVDGSLNMTGYFSAPVFDGPSYSLNAVAVPEPGTLLLLAFGGIMLKRRS